jgi:hypothetical protein
MATNTPAATNQYGVSQVEMALMRGRAEREVIGRSYGRDVTNDEVRMTNRCYLEAGAKTTASVEKRENRAESDWFCP